MATISGAKLMARELKRQGVDYLFGIVGFPVVPIAIEAQKAGITYIGMRNEQSASYAAQAASYMLGRPQACLVVSGPGVIHALAGLANAQQNCWPMLLIGGASSQRRDGMADFQEEHQVELCRPYCKYSARVETVRRIPFLVEQALRTSWYGRPGAAFLDMPDDVILGEIDLDDVAEVPILDDPPRTLADPQSVTAALDALKAAENPLVIVGKGMAWSRAESEVRRFIDHTQLPFLATPMGKGVVADDHPLSVGGARSYALKNADAILLLGARLNWILHFGLPPRFRPDVKILQVDIAADQISHNVKAHAAMVGDGKAVMQQFLQQLDSQPWEFGRENEFRAGIAQKIAENEAAVEPQVNADEGPVNYYRAFRDIKEFLRPDDIIIGEGANTMDIGRTQMANVHPRHRLDAGSYGTMGIGLGFAVAAAVCNPGRRVVAVQGDSAFGFSGMECETICRYNLPITIIVMNNNGIGGGLAELPADRQAPPNMLMPGARYEQVMEAFGGNGWYCTEPAQISAALDEAAARGGPGLVHVVLDPRAGRKPQEFAWKS
ncbi:MAG: thiamine pyrophosphate-binding protein [Acidimicrobiia bacterium]|nr:thiamine pyrophosphate-binding protein [Acidimicrobiia bacterium]